MTTALEEDEGSASRPGRYLPPGKTRYPLYRRLGGPRAGMDRCEISRPPLGFDSRTVQPAASRYTDYATRPTIYKYQDQNFARHTIWGLLRVKYTSAADKDKI